MRQSLNRTLPITLASAAPLATALPADAQWMCPDPHWLPRIGVVEYTPFCTAAWDPDGPGPMGSRLVIGGNFAAVGTIPAQGLAAWDPATAQWSIFGSGLGGDATALAPLPNGNLLVGGSFSTAGGVVAYNIARWDGSAFTPLGAGLNGDVSCILPLANGDVIVGGGFAVAGGAPAGGIARWNGAAWSALGSGVVGRVDALAQQPNGDIIAAGLFTDAGGAPANHIARWNGSAWSPLGAGMGGASYASVRALAQLPGGDLIAAGSFTTAGGISANHIARWDGSAWTPLGDGVSWWVNSLTLAPGGGLIVAGDSVLPSGSSYHECQIMKWDDPAWSPVGAVLWGFMGPPYPSVFTVCLLPSGDLFAGGYFLGAGAYTSPYLARFGCPPCPANCDFSTTPPVLNINDFLCFINRFASGESLANCDNSTRMPILNILDFTCFLNAFAAGCS